MIRISFDNLSPLEKTAMMEARIEMETATHTMYSHFDVGSVAITRHKRRYGGSNQETASPQGAMCGERISQYNAKAHNEAEDIETVVIITRGKQFVSKKAAMSCFPCREVNYESSYEAGRDIKFIFSSTDMSDIAVTTASELLPFPYSPILHGYDASRVDNIFGIPKIETVKYDSLPAAYMKLIRTAEDQWEKSYDIYTGVREGIAVLMKDGITVKGKNIENAAFTPTTDAVSNVLSKIHDRRVKQVDTLAFVVGRVEGPYRATGPTGRGRQNLYELLDGTGLDFNVILFTPDRSQIVITTARKLLPWGFGPSDLLKEKEATKYFQVQ